jgi:hypothetical protein
MTKLNVAEAPLASDAMLHVIMPVPPTAGAAQLNEGPLVCVAETNVVPAGVVSVSCTLAASDGPAFATVTVYVMSVPGATAAGPFFVTLTSALAATVAVVVAEFVGVGSVVDEVTVAVFAIVLPLGAEDAMSTTMSNVAVLPAESVAIEQLIVAPPVHVNVGPLV